MDEKGRTLSKLILLNAVLSTMSLYFISYFIIPRWVGQKIDRLRSRFLLGDSVNYEKKFHLVVVDQVCKAKREGRLGLLNLKSFYLALIAKWGWRLLSQQRGTMQTMLRKKYGPRREC